MKFYSLFSLLLLLLLPGSLAMAQQAAPQNQPTSEMETKEAPAKFTSRVNLVPVTVVVRDRNGKAVGNLTKEDFRLLDNGKPQVISRFSIEKPGAPVVLEKEAGDLELQPDSKPPEAGAAVAAPPVLADHFVAYLFDDVHVQAEDIMRARDAAARVIATSMQPADRAAIYTTSGQIVLEFTNDKAKLQDTLARLRPAPVAGGLGHGMDCPDISYYMADRIVNMNDPMAIQVALVNYQACSGNQYATANEVMGYAQGALHSGEHETRLAASVLVQVVRRIAAMPGQRSIVLASPGFLVPFADQPEITDVINRAIRANVIISTLDVRGLWTPPGLDASRVTPAGGPQVLNMVNQYLQEEAQAGEFVMEDLAHATGGDWFHANNDLMDGFRRLAASPEFIYVLAFTPENLKSDGKYHKLQVTLREPKGVTLQVRKGYYAPRRETDAMDQAKQDVEDAVFSREVIKDIPLAVHTQFFRSGDVDANVSVVAQLDIKSLHYKKEEGRNHDTLTIVSVLFDLNGNYVAGEQKLLTLRLKDETLEKRLDSGIRIKTSFNVKVGGYVVRVVVRDSEGQMMAAENTAVEIQ
jgi:VWFA-related protein